jgi:uncharacterized protein
MRFASRHAAAILLASALAVSPLAAGGALAATAPSRGLEQAMAYHLNGDSKKAIREWERLAKKNDPDALFNLGQVYRLGLGVNADSSKAEAYFRRAAELGHTPAKRELGALELFQNPQPRNRQPALALLKDAAGSGDAKAEYLLGVLYFGGDMLEPDSVRAYAWTLLALEGGWPDAAQSEAAMRRALSDAEIAEAFDRSRTFITGEPVAAPYGLLIGEQPAPHRAASVAAEAPPMEPAPESGGVEETTLIPPAAEPEAATTVVGEAAPVESAPGPAAAETEAPSATMAEAETQAEAAAPAHDLGDPNSPLVDAEGFAGSWSIQLASFRTPEKADAEWRDLRKRHADIFAQLSAKIIRSDLGEDLGVRYRLRAGPFAGKDEAAAACTALKEAGVGCLVVGP